MLRRIALSITLAFGGCFAPGLGGAAETRVVDPVFLDMLVVLDRSGSMIGANWTGTVSGLNEFFNHHLSSGTSVGLNFFSVDGAPNQCEPTLYDPMQVDLGELPGHATILQNALSTQSPGGATPTHPALEGSLAAAITRSLSHPDHEVIVVLVTDGSPSECVTDISQIAALASAALNGYSLRSYVVGLPGSTGAELNQIASGGGTLPAFMLDDASSLGRTLTDIRIDALGLAIFADGFEDGDTTGWSDVVP